MKAAENSIPLYLKSSSFAVLLKVTASQAQSEAKTPVNGVGPKSLPPCAEGSSNVKSGKSPKFILVAIDPSFEAVIIFFLTTGLEKSI